MGINRNEDSMLHQPLSVNFGGNKGEESGSKEQFGSMEKVVNSNGKGVPPVDTTFSQTTAFFIGKAEDKVMLTNQSADMQEDDKRPDKVSSNENIASPSLPQTIKSPSNKYASPDPTDLARITEA